jgi:adenylate cyclase
LLEQAIGRDPCYGPALALAAVFYTRVVIDGWSGDPKTDTRRGIDLGRRALQIAGDDPVTIANAAQALTFFGEDITTMMALVDRALAINPSFARGWYISAAQRLLAGQPDRAIELAEFSMRLSPRARIGAVYNTIGAAHFLSRRFEEAIPNCSLRSRSFQTSRRPIAIWPLATLRWGGWTRRARS